MSTSVVMLPYPEAQATHEQVVRDYSLFRATLHELLQQLGIKPRIMKVGGYEVDLHKLYKEVTKLGGVDNVRKQKQWVAVCKPFCFPPTFTNKAYLMRNQYMALLFDYEQVYFHRLNARKPTTTTVTASDASRAPTTSPCGSLSGPVICSGGSCYSGHAPVPNLAAQGSTEQPTPGSTFTGGVVSTFGPGTGVSPDFGNVLGVNGMMHAGANPPMPHPRSPPVALPKLSATAQGQVSGCPSRSAALYNEQQPWSSSPGAAALEQQPWSSSSTHASLARSILTLGISFPPAPRPVSSITPHPGCTINAGPCPTVGSFGRDHCLGPVHLTDSPASKRHHTGTAPLCSLEQEPHQGVVARPPAAGRPPLPPLLSAIPASQAVSPYDRLVEATTKLVSQMWVTMTAAQRLPLIHLVMTSQEQGHALLPCLSLCDQSPPASNAAVYKPTTSFQPSQLPQSPNTHKIGAPFQRNFRLSLGSSSPGLQSPCSFREASMQSGNEQGCWAEAQVTGMDGPCALFAGEHPSGGLGQCSTLDQDVKHEDGLQGPGGPYQLGAGVYPLPPSSGVCSILVADFSVQASEKFARMSNGMYQQSAHAHAMQQAPDSFSPTPATKHCQGKRVSADADAVAHVDSWLNLDLLSADAEPVAADPTPSKVAHAHNPMAADTPNLGTHSAWASPHPAPKQSLVGWKRAAVEQSSSSLDSESELWQFVFGGLQRGEDSLVDASEPMDPVQVGAMHGRAEQQFTPDIFDQGYY